MCFVDEWGEDSQEDYVQRVCEKIQSDRRAKQEKKEQQNQTIVKFVEEYYQQLINRRYTRTNETKEMLLASLLTQQTTATASEIAKLPAVALVMLYERLLKVPIYTHSTPNQKKVRYLNDIPEITPELAKVTTHNTQHMH
jgi:hypothetical protein